MPATTESRAPGRTRRRVATTGAAVLAAVAVWVVAVPVLGRELAVESWSGGAPMSVSLPMVIVMSLVAALAAWALLAILERLTSRARYVWTAVTSVVLLASLVMPLTAAVDGGTAGALAGMHAAVGAVLIPLLPRS